MNHGPWLLKRYEITLDGAPLPAATWQAAAEHLAEHMASPPDGPALGFLTLHPGAERVWLLLDQWRGDILYHVLYSAPLTNPTRFRREPADGPTCCVWEMQVLHHERDAFVRWVLDPAEGPDVAGYLADQLTVEV